MDFKTAQAREAKVQEELDAALQRAERAESMTEGARGAAAAPDDDVPEFLCPISTSRSLRYFYPIFY